MAIRLVVVVVTICVAAGAYIWIKPNSTEEHLTPSTKKEVKLPDDLSAGLEEILAAETENSNAPVTPPQDPRGETAVEFAQSIYEFDLEYQQRAQAAAEAYLAPWGAEAVLRWRPLHVDPNAVLLAGYMQPNAMPERLVFSPFDDMVFEAVRTDYKIRGAIESARWQGRLVGAHTGRVDLVIVGGESNPSFVLKILSGPDDQPMVYSIIPTLESNVYVAIEGNPNQSIHEM